jgi:hypothetical protein
MAVQFGGSKLSVRASDSIIPEKKLHVTRVTELEGGFHGVD